MLFALQRDDDRYLDIVRKFENGGQRGAREIDLFAGAFAQLQRGMQKTDADLLGEIYEQLSIGSEHFGQYFTPHNICEAVVEMQKVADGEARADRDSPVTVYDPACGSGRMLVVALRRNPEGVFVGQDKDVTCAKMTALNLCLFNVDGYAICGDTLRLEKRRVWRTRRTAFGGVVRELAEDEFPEFGEMD